MRRDASAWRQWLADATGARLPIVFEDHIAGDEQRGRNWSSRLRSPALAQPVHERQRDREDEQRRGRDRDTPLPVARACGGLLPRRMNRGANAGRAGGIDGRRPRPPQQVAHHSVGIFWTVHEVTSFAAVWTAANASRNASRARVSSDSGALGVHRKRAAMSSTLKSSRYFHSSARL